MTSPSNLPRSAPPLRPPQTPRGRRSPGPGPAARPGLRPIPRAGRLEWKERARRLAATAFGRRPPPIGTDPGFESAGRVFAVFTAALVLAALVNADAMVDRAERKPIGPDRDRSLAIWHPVQDVSHILQLHRIRAVGDAFVGDEKDDDRSPTPSAPVDERATATSTTVPPRPELRQPTASAPLRVWVGGDSMMRDLSESVQRATAANPLLSVTTHYEISSGLTRPDYYDWPAALVGDMTSTEAEVVIVMFGANDGQGLIAADGTVHQRVSDPGWQREYASRVGAVMDQLQAQDRLVLWVAQPPMRDGDFDARIRIINGIYRDAASSRPWVDLVETAPLFGDGQGHYADRLPGPGGELRDLRQQDGIHFSREGADLLAASLVARIADELRAPTAETTSTTTGG